MKNTKSRKKILLSSIAMLLVALVALGSATYAWFSVSKTVTANNMYVKAIAAAGLEISKTSSTSGYGTTVTFGQDDTTTFGQLKPVSWDETTHHGFIPAGNVASGGGSYSDTTAGYTDTRIDPETVTRSNAYFATYVVWIRSASDGSKRAAHDVDAKVTIGGEDNTFARAYLIDDTTAANNATFADTATAFNAITDATGTTTPITPIAAASGGTKTVSDTVERATAADNDAGQKYTLVVWFDGEDADCVDTAKNKFANFTIEFTATDM